MTIKDIIANKDFDYVEVRAIVSEDPEDHIFEGVFKVKKGVIISLDGDNYNENEEVAKYEKWSEPEMKIRTGLTIILPYKQ